jgi:limonene-1,2-epoxide hydrolase
MTDAQRVVAAFIAAIEAKDVTGACAMLAEDVSYENVPMSPIVGRAATQAVLDGIVGAATSVEWEVLRELADGNTVANERIDRFVMATGSIELPVAGFFEVNDDGLITLWRDYFDLNTYMTQMAALSA